MTTQDIKKIAIIAAPGEKVLPQVSFALDVAMALRAAGREIVIFGQEDDADLAIFQTEGFATTAFPSASIRKNRPWEFIANVACTFSALRANEIELVHSMSIPSLASFLPAAKMLGLPTIAHVQPGLTPEDLISPMFRYADLIVPDTVAVEQILMSELPPKNQKALYRLHSLQPLVNPLDENAPERGESLRDRLGVSPDELVIGVIGELLPKNGIDLMIDALELVAKRGLRPRVWVVGRDPDPMAANLDELNRHAANLGVRDQITFWTQFTDMPAFHAAIDILAAPHRFGAMNRYTAEAMFGGTAIVATETGGIPHLIENGRTGLHVPPVDPEAFSKSLFQLLVDMELRSELTENALQYVEANFSPDHFLASILDAHDKAAKASAQTRFMNIFDTEIPLPEGMAPAAATVDPEGLEGEVASSTPDE